MYQPALPLFYCVWLAFPINRLLQVPAVRGVRMREVRAILDKGAVKAVHFVFAGRADQIHARQDHGIGVFFIHDFLFLSFGTFIIP